MVWLGLISIIVGYSATFLEFIFSIVYENEAESFGVRE
jgi:hypothetical protein